MLTWVSEAAMRASSMNMVMNSCALAPSVNTGRMRLTAQGFSTPAAPCCTARNTSAIPPRARVEISRYLPNDSTVGAEHTPLCALLEDVAGLHLFHASFPQVNIQNCSLNVSLALPPCDSRA